ncbi:MAG: MFS transporter [SAR324 cluster bacterium]|nr:MFS transporter [SAR324 cluster bacterium]MBL7035826.1 MFS transporter [SAR324 cluster bacterium]
MKSSSLNILLVVTVLSFSTLYSPQPILPLLAQEFSITGSKASLLISLTLFPLGLTPIIFGYLIDNFSARTIMLCFISMLTFSEFSFVFVTDFQILLGLRLLQGLLLSAIFTAIITYIGNQSSSQQRQKAVSSYISATIIGGFTGRFFTGFIADFTNWRVAFIVWTVGLLYALFLLRKLEKDAPSQGSHLPIKGVWKTFRQPRHYRVYLTAFIVFFAFASVLNVLPFRIREIMPSSSESLIASAYLGYLMGIVISLNAQSISTKLGSPVNSTLLGITAFCLGIMMLAGNNLILVFSAVFVFSSGFFLMHSTLSAYINQHTKTQRGVANGLYIAFYYAGGSLGSYLPLIVFDYWGWHFYLLVVISSSLIGLLIIFGLKAIDRTELKKNNLVV